MTLAAAHRGAQVKAIDVNPEMLAVARERARHAGLLESIELSEMGVAELDQEPSESCDVRRFKLNLMGKRLVRADSRAPGMS